MSIADSCTATLHPEGAEGSIDFCAYGLTINIRADSSELLRRILPALPYGWSKSRGSPATRSYFLRSADHAYTLHEGPQIKATCTTPEALMLALEEELTRLIMVHASDRVIVHAGAVGWKGRAIIFPGHTCTGKTTLSRALLAEGAVLYSDDLVVFDRRGRVWPYLRPLRLREERRRVSLADLGGVAGEEPIPVGLVVLTEYRRDVCWQPRPMSAGDGILSMLAHTPSISLRPQAVLSALRRATADALFLKGPRGEATEVARQLLAGAPLVGASSRWRGRRT